MEEKELSVVDRWRNNVTFSSMSSIVGGILTQDTLTLTYACFPALSLSLSLSSPPPPKYSTGFPSCGVASHLVIMTSLVVLDSRKNAAFRDIKELISLWAWEGKTPRAPGEYFFKGTLSNICRTCALSLSLSLTHTLSRSPFFNQSISHSLFVFLDH